MAAAMTSKIALPPLEPFRRSNTKHHSAISQYHTTCPPKASSPTTRPTSRSPLSDAQRWHHLSTRTPPATPFIYAVLTTKIYCLPTCPSRLARRANIVFFTTPNEAANEGFRACKRCKPDLSPSFTPARSGNFPRPRNESISATSSTDESTAQTNTNANEQSIRASNIPEFDPTDPSLKLHLAISLVKSKSQSGEKISLAQLAQEVGLSKWHLQRAFKRRCGRSPREMGEALLKERQGLESAEATNNPQGKTIPSEQETARMHDANVIATDNEADFSTLPTLPPETDLSMDTEIEMPLDPDLDLWVLNTEWEAEYKLANSPPELQRGDFQQDTGNITPTGSSTIPAFTPATDSLTESSSSYATTPAPPTDFSFSPLMSDMDFTYDTNFYPDGFSPDVEGVLRDLFPEIYDENSVIKGQDMMME